MGKLILIYGVMGAGKTSRLVQDVYNLEQKNFKVLLAKPHADKKGGNYLDSRMIGKFYRPVDVSIESSESFIQACSREGVNPLKYNYVAVDEAQFLSKEQVFEMWVIAKKYDLDFICSSLKTNFLGELFEGSKELLSKSDEKTELFRSCQIAGCRELAQYNARKVNGEWACSGDEVVIDGTQNVEYVSMCGQHYYELVMVEKGKQFVLR